MAARRTVLLTLSLLLPLLPRAAPGAPAACTAQALPLVFGSLAATSARPLDFTTTVRVTCVPQGTATVAYRVMLSAGTAGQYGHRVLAGGGLPGNGGGLVYQLYADPARSLVWGDGSAGTASPGAVYVLRASDPARTDSFPVYGRLYPRPGASAGGYVDAIMVTVVTTEGQLPPSR
jgi:spore coat protein U-like protein